jgi:hypothetical protein
MSTKEVKLPLWFNGKIYKEGGIVENRFSGEEYELNNIELSMYDLIMGATIVLEMGVENDEIIKTIRKGLDWFRKNNPKAYIVLLD